MEVGLTPGQLTWHDDGLIHCAAGVTAYWATRESHANFRLTFETRWPGMPGNSGTLVYMRGDTRPFPECLEVQGLDTDMTHIFPIAGAKEVPRTDDGDARARAHKNAPEWNAIAIESRDGVVRSWLNGVPIGVAGPGELREGPIGFQCEGAEIEWRNVVLEEL